MPIFPVMPIPPVDLNKLRDRVLSAMAALLGQSVQTERILETVDNGIQQIAAVGKDFVDAERLNAIAHLMEAEALLMDSHAKMRAADAEYIKAEAMREYLHAKVERERAELIRAHAEAQRAQAIRDLIPLLAHALRGCVRDFEGEVERPLLFLLPPGDDRAS